MQKTGNAQIGIVANINPVHISMTGYCQEIFVPQPLHLPLWIKKLKMGISSNHLRVFPRWGQADLPPKFFSACLPAGRSQRNPTTLRKLPTQAPRINKKKGIIIFSTPQVSPVYTQDSPVGENLANQISLFYSLLG